MRRVVVGLAMLGLAQSAFAADLDDALRGSTAPTYHWGGVYAGGQVGYSSANVDFGNGVSSLINFALRNTRVNADLNVSDLTVLGKRDTNSTSFGGFVGYNWEYEEVILGVEANYSRMNVLAAASDQIGRVFPDTNVSPNYVYDVQVTGKTSIHITDLATLRGRAGWEAGRFLPYGFLGFAVGRADTSSSATVAFCGYDSVTPALATSDPIGCASPGNPTGTRVAQSPQTQAKAGQFIFGGATGLGVDVAILPNVFLRGEWEYVQFLPINGMHVGINSFRTGAGVMF